MKTNKSLNSTKAIKIYYFLILFAVLSQTILTCIKLGQTICYQSKLQQAQMKKNELQKEYEHKQAQFNLNNSLLANQVHLDERYVSISSALVISTQNTLALR